MVKASELTDLSTAEKIQLVTELWDQIATQSGVPPLPAAALDEAERRAAQLERDPANGITEAQLWREVVDAR